MNAFIAEYGEFVVAVLMGISVLSGLSYILTAITMC